MSLRRRTNLETIKWPAVGILGLDYDCRKSLHAGIGARHVAPAELGLLAAAEGPDLHDAVSALEASLRGSASPPPPATTDDVTALHQERLLVQLERQTARNEILIRQAAKSWRKSKRSRQMRPIHVAGEGQDQQIDDPGLRVKSGSERADQRLDLMAVLKTLQPEHREVIVMREFQGLSYQEIAQALGVPRGTIDSRIHRARLEMRERLKSYGVDEGAGDAPRKRGG